MQSYRSEGVRLRVDKERGVRREEEKEKNGWEVEGICSGLGPGGVCGEFTATASVGYCGGGLE